MHNLKFKISHFNNNYEIYIEREVSHLFRTKKEARDYIKKYRAVLTDNLPIMLNIQGQLEMLRNQHYQFMNTQFQRSLYNELIDFEEEFSQIFFNRGGDNHATVQFKKIRVCFNILENVVFTLKRYGQKNKRAVMLNQLYGVEKILILTEKNYNREVKGLFVAHGYRESLRKLKLTKNEEHIPHKTSKSS